MMEINVGLYGYVTVGDVYNSPALTGFIIMPSFKALAGISLPGFTPR